jgi:hypothetical protein
MAGSSNMDTEWHLETTKIAPFCRFFFACLETTFVPDVGTGTPPHKIISQ